MAKVTALNGEEVHLKTMHEIKTIQKYGKQFETGHSIKDYLGKKPELPFYRVSTPAERRQHT